MYLNRCSLSKPTVGFLFAAQEDERRTARPARKREKTVRRTVFPCAARNPPSSNKAPRTRVLGALLIPSYFSTLPYSRFSSFPPSLRLWKRRSAARPRLLAARRGRSLKPGPVPAAAVPPPRTNARACGTIRRKRPAWHRSRFRLCGHAPRR